MNSHSDEPIVQVIHGDCLAILPTLEDDSIDSCVTDPPYHLASIVKRFGGENAAPAKGNEAFVRASKGFMGEVWDGGDIAFRPETWAEVYRVLKPGGYLLAFAGTRNSHRMVCAIEDAGFEIRDSIASLSDGGLDGPLLWAYGVGFPKSHDVSKGIDRAAGAEREVVGTQNLTGTARIKGNGNSGHSYDDREIRDSIDITAPATDAAKQWQGWGSALKPAHEPICMARKPLSEKTIAANVLMHGTGGINIDACRIGTTKRVPGSLSHTPNTIYGTFGQQTGLESGHDPDIGRWPANLVHDGSDEVLAAFAAFGERTSGCADGQRARSHNGSMSGDNYERTVTGSRPGDTGSAARFFYSAKANATDRAGSKHPTVKPLSLISWLVRMVTPPGGTIIDPFAGSGTTGQAARDNGFNAILIEREQEYVDDIKRRLDCIVPEPKERHAKKEFSLLDLL